MVPHLQAYTFRQNLSEHGTQQGEEGREGTYLGGVVENRSLSGLDELRKRLLGLISATNKTTHTIQGRGGRSAILKRRKRGITCSENALVQIGHVCCVMLAIVVLQGLLANVRGQSSLGIGKRVQGEGIRGGRVCKTRMSATGGTLQHRASYHSEEAARYHKNRTKRGREELEGKKKGDNQTRCCFVPVAYLRFVNRTGRLVRTTERDLQNTEESMVEQLHCRVD